MIFNVPIPWYNLIMNKLSAQNRLIVSVIVLSTVLIAAAAFFAVVHVKQLLYAGYGVDETFAQVRVSMLGSIGLIWFLFTMAFLINTYLVKQQFQIFHKGVRKISTGEFGYKLEHEHAGSKVRELFNSFNSMSNKLLVYEEQNIEQLTLERNKLEAILMSIANGVVVCDNFDNIVLVNEHAQNLLGIDAEIKIQEYADTSGNLCFKDKIEEFKDTPLSLMESKPLEFNIKVDERTIKSVISPMFTRNKDYVGYIIVLIDMTKEAEVDKIRSHFISNVSHELRTPVTVLRSYIDTLYSCGEDFGEAEKREFIGIINTEIIRLNSMVNDILDFSRIDENDVMEKELNSLVKVVENSVKQLQVLAKERGLKISVSKKGTIAKIMFNYNAIERAFTNLLSNAIKYSPDGGEIEVRLRALKGEVELSVSDQGPGIAPEHQKHIFDRFYRVETSAHTIKGTGLGLHLVKTAIEKHHQGSVFVRCEPGKGATFGFCMPVKSSKEINLS